MKLQFIKKQPELRAISSFYFLPPENASWIAGQSIRLEIEAGYSTEERRFSISSAPFEKHIRITTRESGSEFKQALAALQPGETIDAFAIEGDFVWGKPSANKLLCAQGIGITPYRSMLRQLDYEGHPIEATLLYANRGDSFLFKDELEKLARRHPKLHVTLLPAQVLSVQTIQSHVKNIATSDIYLSSTSEMVDTLSPVLLEAGLPKSHLKQDWFTGLHGQNINV